MAKRLLIIGNGFDIDLGLKTRYSDFSKSNNWKTCNRLFLHIVYKEVDITFAAEQKTVANGK